jgi:site-specific DNA-methyltransferase (adenine-specific)
VAVSEVLVKQSSEPGEVIADPFMGSGSIGVAAVKCGRRFLGNDLNPDAVRIAGERLATAAASFGGASGTAKRGRDLLDVERLVR